MKKSIVGLGLVGILALSALPAAAQYGDEATHNTTTTMERSRTVETEAGFLGPGDIIAFNQPLAVTGTINSIRTGLIHLTTAEGMHLIVPQTLAFWQNDALVSPLGLAEREMVTVVIPNTHNWVMNTSATLPFASEFSNQDVVLLGGYEGTIWIPRSALLNADLDFVADSGVMSPEAEAAEVEADKPR